MTCPGPSMISDLHSGASGEGPLHSVALLCWQMLPWLWTDRDRSQVRIMPDAVTYYIRKKKIYVSATSFCRVPVSLHVSEGLKMRPDSLKQNVESQELPKLQSST